MSLKFLLIILPLYVYYENPVNELVITSIPVVLSYNYFITTINKESSCMPTEKSCLHSGQFVTKNTYPPANHMVLPETT